jgi:NADPH:quinone reductase-like Zn-dependent oxidoreductase
LRQAYAQYTAVPAKHTIKVPDNVPGEVAGGSIVGGITTLTLVQEAYAVKKGDWILVHAAAGGTGQLLGQVLKDLGAHSIGTVSTAEKGKLAKAVGFEHVIETYDHDTVLNKVKELTGGNGVIAVYDGVPTKFPPRLDGALMMC